MPGHAFLVHHLLERAADLHPDKPAVCSGGRWTSFADLDLLANRIGSCCLARGLAAGDRVVILFENSVEFVASYFGVLKAGGVAVPIGADATAAGFGYVLRHSGARGLIAGSRFAGLAHACASSDLSFVITKGAGAVEESAARVDRCDLEAVLHEGDRTCAGPARIDADLESIVYTSGSTGEPKGVMLTHLNTLSNMRSIVEYLGLESSDRVMAVLPFSYIYGKSLLLTHVLAGGSVVIDNRFAFPNVVIDAMVETGATGFAGVPSTFSFLLSRSKIRETRIATLRYVSQAGGSMPVAAQKEVAEVFKPARLYVMYGATEAAPRITYLDPADLPRKWGSIGKAVPNVAVLVVDEQGRPLPAGQTGEIVARGSNIMKGYWKDERGTAAVLRGDLYYTGDLGHADEEGFLYMDGRKRDIIKVRGYRVSPKTIEDAISEIAGVQEVAVKGMPDGMSGECVCAFVVSAPGADLSDESIRRYLGSRLRHFEIPQLIDIRSDLPKNPSGKIMKSRLKPSRPSASMEASPS